MGDLNIIAFANVVNAVGVISLIIGHWYVSIGNREEGFKIASIGSLIVAGGSLLLQSYPVVLLNIIWFSISVYGYYNIDKANVSLSENGRSGLMTVLIGFIFLFASSYSVLNQSQFGKEVAAYMVVTIYVSTYYMMAKGLIKKVDYLFWTFGAYFLLIPHLLLKNQYSVLFNETIGAIISLIGLIKLIKKSN